MSTYTPISSITLASAASEVIFSGIPQTYTDLIIAGNGIKSGDHGIDIQFNNDTGSNYSVTFLYGDGTSAVSGRGSNQTAASGGRLATNGAVSLFHIMNYANTTTNKTMLSRGSNAAAITIATVSLWRSTAAINSIKMSPGGGGDFASGSTFNLYGIANASITNVAKATGGDSVYTDGTYWYHIFRSSGTFTPTQALTADYLVVAGGAGGGSESVANQSVASGGGGAGGLRCTVTATGGGGSLESALSLTAQAYTVTVGAGGAGGSGGATQGTNGSNSVFSTITSTGGGGGGSRAVGSTGGSGGGGGGVDNRAGGAGTTNQGYAGGNGLWTTNSWAGGGGGGGANAVGANATTNGNAGAGGAGVATSITGSSVTYAGGGGGGGSTSAGAGGSGGGGAGGSGSGNNGTAATANTGGGGGGVGFAVGGSGSANGGNGGSGIVIVRYGI